jgi:sec-independent protein translocase protein TatB
LLDIGWSEMFVILVVALIVIGPKDLPRVARTLGKWVGKARALAREFQSSIEEMAREAELDDVKKTIEQAGRTDFRKTVEKAVDPRGELKGAFDVGRADEARPKPTPSPATKRAGGTGALPPAEGEASGPPRPPADGTSDATEPAAGEGEAERERVAAGSP